MLLTVPMIFIIKFKFKETSERTPLPRMYEHSSTPPLEKYVSVPKCVIVAQRYAHCYQTQSKILNMLKTLICLMASIELRHLSTGSHPEPRSVDPAEPCNLGFRSCYYKLPRTFTRSNMHYIGSL